MIFNSHRDCTTHRRLWASCRPFHTTVKTTIRIRYDTIRYENAYMYAKMLVYRMEPQTKINEIELKTRRPASADRTARRQFQTTGQLVSRTQTSDAMTSRLPRYETKCVQCGCFQSGSVLCIQTSRNGATPCQYLDTTRKAIDCATTLLLTVFI